MAVKRRALPFMDYGPSMLPRPQGATAPLPPPPDGNIPVRLPVGAPNAPPQPPMPTQNNPASMTDQGGDDTPTDPMAMMLRLLQNANRT